MMSSPKTLAGKVNQLVEEISGCPYEVVTTVEERLDWFIRHPPPQSKSEVGDPCYAYPELNADGKSIETSQGTPDVSKVLEHSYGLWISLEELDKLMNSDVRKKLEKIIPAIVKNYDIIFNGVEEAAKKYGLQGQLWVKSGHHLYVHFGATFDASNMSDEEVLKAIEPRFRAVGEVSYKYRSWLGFGTEFSPERKALIAQGVHVPGLPGRLRRDGYLVIDWPPNTGTAQKDEEMRADIRKYLKNNWAEVFTPEGRLKLVNEEIILVKPKKKG